MESDLYWMQQAFSLAHKAKAEGEVPIGAILVKDGKVIAEGMNSSIQQSDPTAHAEIIALRNAGKQLNNYRLVNTALYVTLEPCLMCAAALIHARVSRLIFAAFDLKAGAIVSKTSVLDYSFQNHKVTYVGGIMEDESVKLLQDFFMAKRKLSKQK